MGQFTSGLGAHLTWTLPFGLLVMFAIFNRFDARYEEAARDQGATPWQTLRYVVLPIVAPSVVGVGLFGFTLSWDEIARSSQTMGEHNTLPMELQALDDDGDQPRHLRAGHFDDGGLVRGHRDGAVRDLDPATRGRSGMAPTPARLDRGMRLLVVNPNTSASMTARIGAAARAAAAAGTEIVAVNPVSGPASIEGYFDEAFAVPGMIEEIMKGEAAGVEAFVIACFDDTGLEAARCAANGPVIGIGEAAFHLAVADRASLQRRHHAFALDRADRDQSDEIRPRPPLRAGARLRGRGAGAGRPGLGRARETLGGDRARQGRRGRRGDRARLRRHGRTRRLAGARTRTCPSSTASRRR